MNFNPISLDITSYYNSEGPSGLLDSQSMISFFLIYQELVKFVGYYRLDFICFYELFTLRWEPFLKPFEESSSA